jgi:alanyl aminopeptidase
VDLSRADPDVLRSALQVTVQEDGAPAFDAVQSEFAVNRDTTQRYALLAALGATRDPALGEKARDFGLDPSVQVGELFSIYEAQENEPENRAAMWQWLQAHYDAYRVRLPAFRAGYMPKTFAEARCSGHDADEMSAYFAPRIKDLIGGDRGLAQTLETIRQCASLREHEGPNALAAWIETREAHPHASGSAAAPAKGPTGH